MADRNNLLHEKTGLLQDFLQATQSISEQLFEETSTEMLDSIQEKVEERDRIIARVKEIGSALAALGEPDKEQKDEQDKQTWLWQQIFEQIQALEDKNTVKLKSLMELSMDKVRSSQESIRVIGAYSKQMTEEDVTNVDKSK